MASIEDIVGRRKRLEAASRELAAAVVEVAREVSRKVAVGHFQTYPCGGLENLEQVLERVMEMLIDEAVEKGQGR